jgi:serine/threonine-protein kinase
LPETGGTDVWDFESQIDEVCDLFEAAWKGGGRPRIEDYLDESPVPARVALLRELIPLDMEYRKRNGETVRENEYRDRFPSWSPDESALGPGSTIPLQAGLYCVESEIGTGGMGEVYRVQDSDLNRSLAVKVLRREHRGQPDLETRFLEEAQILGQLQHPGIVPVHDVGRLDDGRPFFVMKLVKGQTLEELLQERPRPDHDLPRFLAIFEQICQTMANAHAHGVIHRDLKPSNVMVGAFGEVQVMDWGLAKVLAGRASGGREAAEESASVLQTVRTKEPAEASQPGAILGTYAYMPPEQARGEVDRLDERCDVFGLGAILCTILTRRPPYTGPTHKDLKRQAQECDLVDAGARLARCGADADLVELTRRCLAHEREHRPQDAGAVAQAVTAYRSAVEERARQAEVERAAAEARVQEAKAKARAERRARRLTVGLAAAVLLTLLAGGGSGIWAIQDRAARERSANLILGKAEQLMEQADKIDPDTVAAAEQAVTIWRQAEDLLNQAEGVLASGFGADSARARLAERRRDVEKGLRTAEAVATLLAGLDKARELRSNWRGSDFDYESADQTYADALAAYGLDVFGAEPGAVAAAIQKERPAMRLALIVALDDWSVCARDKRKASRLWQVAGLADDDDWRRRYRAAVAGGDLDDLKRLAHEAHGKPLTAVSVELLAVALRDRGARSEAAALLRHARGQHPTDFWIHFDLGLCLHDWLHPDAATLDEAMGCYWAALALRSGSAPAHINLGLVLQDKGLVDEAIREYRTAIDLDPKLARAHNNLGLALHDKKQLDEAIREYRTAIALDPKDAPAHNNLGVALRDKKQLDEAIREYRTAIALDNDAMAHTNLGIALADKKQLDEAIREYRTAIHLDPKLAEAHYNLGNALADKKQLDEAIRECRTAIELQPDYAEAHCNLGAVLELQGKFPEALAERRIGHELGLKRPGWRERYPSDAWVRNAEGLVRLDGKLVEILQGKDNAANNSERLQLAWICQRPCKKLYAASVRFYGEAFDRDVKLTDNMQRQFRYNAACAAVLAGSGKGEDAAKLDDKDRGRLRKQALDWLRADLVIWAKQAESSKADDRAIVVQILKLWQEDADLACVRDKSALEKLPDAERAEWDKLWAEVAELLKKVQEQK